MVAFVNPPVDVKTFVEDREFTAVVVGDFDDGLQTPVCIRPNARALIPHLTGVRTLLAMWIVCHHMAPKAVASSFSAFTMRVDVAVEFFVMLSGFVTHHAYGDKDLTSSVGSLASFYARRLARVVLTTQLSMGLSLFWWAWGGKPLLSILNRSTLSCLLFVKTWFDPEPDCPNGPTWFVAALLPSWLIYPLITRRVLDRLDSPHGLGLLCVALWLAAIGPQLAMVLWDGDWLTWNEVKQTWFWPPAQLADFALGAGVSALTQRVPPSILAGRIADALVTLVLVVCLLCPVAPTPSGWDGPVFRPGHYIAWDALSGRLAAPALGVFLYGSVSGGCSTARLLAHPALVALGVYALEVYLLQTPVHDLFVWCKDVLHLPQESIEVFILYLLVLWSLSAVYVHNLADPANKWLRRATEDWPTVPFWCTTSELFLLVPTSPSEPEASTTRIRGTRCRTWFFNSHRRMLGLGRLHQLFVASQCMLPRY
jgi:peptidoglycan/LPS O-acetylase OafA/YrhL